MHYTGFVVMIGNCVVIWFEWLVMDEKNDVRMREKMTNPATQHKIYLTMLVNNRQETYILAHKPTPSTAHRN